jgi:hypothetical protein
MKVEEFKAALNSRKPQIRSQAVATATASHRLLMTPIVDDDFPEMKDMWQLELHRLQELLRKQI